MHTLWGCAGLFSCIIWDLTHTFDCWSLIFVGTQNSTLYWQACFCECHSQKQYNTQNSIIHTSKRRYLWVILSKKFPCLAKKINENKTKLCRLHFECILRDTYWRFFDLLQYDISYVDSKWFWYLVHINSLCSVRLDNNTFVGIHCVL